MSRKTMERMVRRKFVTGAARRLFASKGIENTRMEDIAAAVDYTRRTIYSYFKSRYEICLLVFVEDLAARWEEQKRAVALVESGLEKITVWGHTLFTYAQENPHYMRLEAYWDYTRLDPKQLSRESFLSFENLNNGLADSLREMFRLGMQDGSLRPGLHVDMCISQYLYSLRSVIYRALSPGYSFAVFEPGEYVENYLDLFSRGICSMEGAGK
ncbi:MAG: TetR/AcrR family transcriptional regulator [Candidatus Zixiibacteriota bacterium]|nr:MAG: TetR/AcrR family transcriptional regulator [candidate division Zixibacteria bacterium]